jgi:putative copper resistance protein D
VVALVIFGVLFVQWVRHSQREAAREDRRLDRLESRARAANAQR